ncbi:50S ribosomal protein L16, chloroplastic [Apostasia shenzhenica]|uniref:50S ribosomal protein L16, chloroplastic n=1 Tax=Apostasia shenzhenica TaxID=1088818 RepID=A0A2I0A8W1_9ASPA|nr:50S ribosomal protein L16, chloroplastic [Apostasia shenzhenica]
MPHICFGRYALQALEPAWITARQIEAGRRAITRSPRLDLYLFFPLPTVERLKPMILCINTGEQLEGLQ